MDMLISPCKKCGCLEDRKICSQRCKLLAEYRQKLGNPFESCFRVNSHPLELAREGYYWTLPIPRLVVKQKSYDEYDKN